MHFKCSLASLASGWKRIHLPKGQLGQRGGQSFWGHPPAGGGWMVWMHRGGERGRASIRFARVAGYHSNIYGSMSGHSRALFGSAHLLTHFPPWRRCKLLPLPNYSQRALPAPGTAGAFGTPSYSSPSRRRLARTCRPCRLRGSSGSATSPHGERSSLINCHTVIKLALYLRVCVGKFIRMLSTWSAILSSHFLTLIGT